jgi:hypothetical protein
MVEQRALVLRGAHTKQVPLGVVPDTPRYKRFQEQQIYHLERRHLPPWQHKPMDAIVHAATWLGIGVGLVMVGTGFWDLAHGKK